MKIKGDSYLPLAALKGALLTNENGAEFRIVEFTVQLDDVTNVLVSLARYDEEDGELIVEASIALSSIESWTIQLQGETA